MSNLFCGSKEIGPDLSAANFNYSNVAQSETASDIDNDYSVMTSVNGL